MRFDEAVAESGRAFGCGKSVHGVVFAQQLDAAGLQDLVGLLVAGELDASGGVGDQQGGERHACHRHVDRRRWR